MAFPTIPTSFVPQVTTTKHRQPHGDFSGVFDFLSYMILVIVFVLAIGVFAYGRVLDQQKASVAKTLSDAQSHIDQETVRGFVQLRDRLTISKTLLKNHTQVSAFFTALENLIPSNVRFASLAITIDDTGTGKIEGSGVAKSFNTLAATSENFSTDGRIKDVIFSSIVVDNKDNTVSFAISGLLDSKIITNTP